MGFLQSFPKVVRNRLSQFGQLISSPYGTDRPILGLCQGTKNVSICIIVSKSEIFSLADGELEFTAPETTSLGLFPPRTWIIKAFCLFHIYQWKWRFSQLSSRPLQQSQLSPNAKNIFRYWSLNVTLHDLSDATHSLAGQFWVLDMVWKQRANMSCSGGLKWLDANRRQCVGPQLRKVLQGKYVVRLGKSPSTKTDY